MSTSRVPPADTSPLPAARLRRALEETPESGRDALVAARLHELKGNRTDLAAQLLKVLTTSELPGVRPATVAALSSVVAPSTVLRCLSRMPPARSFQIRHICGTLRWQDALSLVSSIRDGRCSLGPYVGFSDEVLTLGFLLASDTHLPYGHDQTEIHRGSGDETIFLFGASRAPGELLRELGRLRIFSWPQQNHDGHLARWALANPALAGSARRYALAQNAPQVIAGLRHDGLIGLAEVVAWLREGTGQEALERSIAVLHLPHDLPGALPLKATTLALQGDLSETISHLSEPTRRGLSTVLSADPMVAEVVDALLPEWRSDVRELLAAASALRERAITDA